MIVNSSKTCAIFYYVLINGNPLNSTIQCGNPFEKVDSFKCLGTIFDNDLKWSSNTDYIYGKVEKRDFMPFRIQTF